MEEDVKETIIKSTAEGMERFVKGHVWEDLYGEMKSWDEELLAKYDGVKDLEDLRWLQGARESIHYCMQLPYRMMEALEADQEEQEKKESDFN